MPLAGNRTYSLPPGYAASPNTPALSAAQHNAPLEDLAAAISTLSTEVRPAEQGGTGSSVLRAMTIQMFTSSATWTKPAGCRFIRIRGSGGGGAGGGAGTGSGPAGGGGGHSGSFGESSMIDVTGIDTAVVVIGAAGAAGTAGAVDGGAGSNTAWGDGTNSLTWVGGIGGRGYAGSTTLGVTQRASMVGLSAVGGATLTGGLNQGGPAMRGSNSLFSGNGGSTPFGTGGDGQDTSAAATGNAGAGYGAGGGGATSTGSADRAGGAGRPGILIVEEYY